MTLNQIFMIRTKFFYIIFTLAILISLNSCGFYKRADVKDNPINVEERTKKNIQEGRGIRFGKGATRGGDFDFASSNPLWRASIEIFDFEPLTNASYSGGKIITDWFSAENKSSENTRDLKITVRSLNKEDIKNRKLPNQTTGLVITSIQNNSPLAGSIEVNSIIVEAQKERIKSIDDLKQITKQVLNSNQKTILLAIYNNQNQRRYIGIKLD